jgi:hypothetical protein
MAGFITLVLETDTEDATKLADRLDRGTKHSQLRYLRNHLNGISGGMKRGLVTTQVASTAATQTIGCDFSDAIDGTDDVTIGPTTLSVEASPSGQDQFDSGATDIAFAANLVTAINDHTTLSKIVVATTDGVDTVTVTCRFPGIIGNEIALTETGDGFTLGAAAMAGGASDEADKFQFGHS